ncbi:hypothetical protein Desaci_0962 [Desulfosporosinus acidiphilus SJ4]|uniref:Uncharacterized protein n=1 Tax=Desulfosporosinus acidiphilus (strain DSM 22704 / JCM 16185 / SJ4) TaxID=646529 RepID=I4D2I3_DESAJ|nr:hypothetical protein Desaci_0962 [Desulfosporosinus acidiphilus SJ4]
MRGLAQPSQLPATEARPLSIQVIFKLHWGSLL